MSTLPVLITEEQPAARPQSKHRFYYYDAEFRLSVAMDITTEGEILVALAACRAEDTFIRRETKVDRKRGSARRNARMILDGRLALQYDLMAKGESNDSQRNGFVVRFSTTYNGDRPLKHVWFPFVDALRKFVHETYGTPYERTVVRDGEETTELAYSLEGERNVNFIKFAIRRWAGEFRAEAFMGEDEVLALSVGTTNSDDQGIHPRL
jgi:hypothetical protein